ncbi:MAG TPA: hypothetical protein ENI27_10820 [bacterium]|nr:hypothetical protein [bacterium]
MNIKVRWYILPFLLILANILGWSPTLAQGCELDPNGQLYCPQTGHWVTGDLLKKYRSVPDSIKLFGYPITEAYQEQTWGRIVQYFERARFEYRPENPPQLRVRISPLGAYLYSPGPVLPIPDNFPACRVFSETGFKVCYAFLDYFDTNGGAAQFGYPISNFEFHDSRIVQYFQRARFEWHPEYPSSHRVTLTNLGRRYFDTLKENRGLLLPLQNNNIAQPVIYLRARVFTQYAVLPQTGKQTIFIIVQDQNLSPVPDTSVFIMVILPSGQVISETIPHLTDTNGVVKYSFDYQDLSPGLAKVLVTVIYNNLQQKSITSFRIWW